MTWFRRLLGRAGRKSATSSLELFREIFGYPASSSGMSITRESALQCMAVLACARVLANGLAQVPLKVYRRRADRGADEARDHPLFWLLHRAPNPFMTSFLFRQMLMLHLLLCGNFFAAIVRVNGAITALMPLMPQSVTVRRHEDGDVSYEIRDAKGFVTALDRRNVWHLRWLSFDGVQGIEGVRLVREAIGLSLAQEKHAAKTFANGSQLAGALQTDGELSPEAYQRIRDEWSRTYGGADHAGKLAILEAGLKWSPMSMDMEKSQFIEGRKFQVEEVARAFGVYPAVIGYSENTATFASVEQFFLAHVIYSLGPHYENVEQSIDVDLLGDRAGEVYAKFTVAGLLRGDAKARGDFYSRGILDGWMTRNEAREREEMNPLPGLDTPLMPLNMAAAGKQQPSDSPPRHQDTKEDTKGDD